VALSAPARRVPKGAIPMAIARNPSARARSPGLGAPASRHRRGGQDGRGREAMDFALSDTQAAIRREALALARTFPLEYWREKDRTATYPHEFLAAFAAGGWLGTLIPEEYGGSGLGITEAALLLEAICAAGAGTSGAAPVHFALFPPLPIIRYGSEALRRAHLPQ